MRTWVRARRPPVARRSIAASRTRALIGVTLHYTYSEWVLIGFDARALDAACGTPARILSKDCRLISGARGPSPGVEGIHHDHPFHRDRDVLGHPDAPPDTPAHRRPLRVLVECLHRPLCEARVPEARRRVSRSDRRAIVARLDVCRGPSGCEDVH